MARCINNSAHILRTELENYAREQLYENIQRCANNSELIGDELAERLAEGGILPMYGMPSRVRNLYHHDPSGRQKFATIDRDLDLSITEFSPSSEKTKDKRIYTSIGFTAALTQGEQNKNMLMANPLSSRKWMLRCQRCQYIQTSIEEINEQNCPICQADSSVGLRIFQWAVPLGFRTSLKTGADAKEEYDILISGAASVAESNLRGLHIVPNTNTQIDFSEAGNVYRINDNRGQYFSGCIGTASVGKSGFLTNRPVG